MPIKDHGEKWDLVGENGDLSFDDLITRLNGIKLLRENYLNLFMVLKK